MIPLILFIANSQAGFVKVDFPREVTDSVGQQVHMGIVSNSGLAFVLYSVMRAEQDGYWLFSIANNKREKIGLFYQTSLTKSPHTPFFYTTSQAPKRPESPDGRVFWPAFGLLKDRVLTLWSERGGVGRVTLSVRGDAVARASKAYPTKYGMPTEGFQRENGDIVFAEGGLVLTKNRLITNSQAMKASIDWRSRFDKSKQIQHYSFRPASVSPFCPAPYTPLFGGGLHPFAIYWPKTNSYVIFPNWQWLARSGNDRFWLFRSIRDRGLYMWDRKLSPSIPFKSEGRPPKTS